ncbi:hypothetical protein Hbut_0077 [Hyperthermus butylicus DSM 5456]|uniref:Uncharacterized protein n=1 Tax=Hyperthermus butylicus (strain DSM 5456 / JCM 9403 / PLM1-5) TaxID=415426 RepID=A2BIZ2_HYPBU|nr:hypothetical protein Hbut_0077 [Hyperthermus butylicus DSM 5456]
MEVLGVDADTLAGRLLEAVERAKERLEECPSGDAELCRMLRRRLDELLGASRLAITPALVVDEEGETVNAFYVEGRTGDTGWIVFSPHTLADPDYVAHILLHELVHALGLENEDETEALALFAENQIDIPEPPPPVREAEHKLRRASCMLTEQEITSPDITVLIVEAR